jgi:putative acetyltransferase
LPEFTIILAPSGYPDAAQLIERHLTLMASQSPSESCHPLDQEGLDADGSRLFLLRRGDAVIAMGALKALRDGALELKSMHTISEARGSGAGKAMLEHLLSVARTEAATSIFLETGSTDGFLPAQKLYADYGFTECPPFADYAEDPWSTFMHLDLRSVA